MITKMITKDDDKNLKGLSKNEFKIFKIESRTLQDSRGNLISRIKIQEIKISRIKIQDSRLKIQESREGLIKISMKRFSQKLSSTWFFSKHVYQRVFTLW